MRFVWSGFTVEPGTGGILIMFGRKTQTKATVEQIKEQIRTKAGQVQDGEKREAWGPV
jgi:hypothetical protein